MGIGRTELSLSSHVFSNRFNWLNAIKQNIPLLHVSCIQICVSCAPGSSFFLSFEPAKADKCVIHMDPVFAIYTPKVHQRSKKHNEATKPRVYQVMVPIVPTKSVKSELKPVEHATFDRRFTNNSGNMLSATLVVVPRYIQLQKNVSKYDQYKPEWFQISKQKIFRSSTNH